MKRLFSLLCAVVAFAACEQAPIEEQSAIRYEAPDTITVGFEGDDTRIQLNEAQKTVWTKGDQVSVFYKSYDNLKFEFEGNTGDRDGTLKRVGGQHNGQTMDDVVVVYPYSADYMITLSEGCVNATIPSTQTYLKGSYGVGDNLMIARSSFNQFSLKSVCGWLKIQLTGDGEVIERITFRSNNGEQVAGLVYVDATTAEATLATAKHNSDDNSQLDGTLVLDDSIYTEVVLDCGEGVALGKNATAFYIALPPQTFEQGFTVEIEDTEGYVMEQSTDKALTIERNHIQPMAALEFINPNGPAQPTPASNQIWYTATAKVEPSFDDSLTFGADVVSNVWNSETKRGIITFDGDVTMIGDDAFNNCDKLTSITLPECVTSIGKKAFYDCDGLTEFTIPDSVTEIGEYAFHACTGLTSVHIPDSVTSIERYAFYHCRSLKEFKGKFATEDGRSLIVDNTIIAYAYASGNTYNIPDGVTTIGERAFYSCDSLTSVNIPDSVTTIGESAFYNCDSLTSVNIPDSVTTIGDQAFRYCDSLKSVYCKATTPPVLGGTYVFDDNGSGRKIYVPAESVEAYKSTTRWNEYASAIVGYDFGDSGLVTPEIDDSWKIHYTATSKVTPYDTSAFNVEILSNEWDSTTGEGVITFNGVVETIDSYAFYMCSNLKSVRIPEHVTSIKAGAFRECIKLNDVYLNSKIESIGSGAFTACFDIYNSTYGSINIHLNSIEDWCKISMPASLVSSQETIYLKINGSTTTDITIPTTIKAIKPYTFRRCAVSSVTLHEEVASIGDKAFYDSWLKNLYCKPTTPPTGGSEMFEETSNLTIYTHRESVDAYKSATGWSDYKYAITGYDFENGVVVE